MIKILCLFCLPIPIFRIVRNKFLNYPKYTLLFCENLPVSNISQLLQFSNFFDFALLSAVLFSLYLFYFEFFEILIDVHVSAGGGDVLIVAHGSTLDCCSRLLTGGKSRTEDDILQIIDQIPYCSVAKIQNRNDKWRLVNSRILSVTHSANKPFDVDVLRKFY